MAYLVIVTGRGKVHAITAAMLACMACEPASAPGANGEARVAAPAAKATRTASAAAAAVDARQGAAPADDDAPPHDAAPTDASPTAVTRPSTAAPAAEPEPEPTPPPPIGRRRAKRAMMVYVQPRLGTEFRGKIPHGEVFELYEQVEGTECGTPGWGRIGAAAYVCLHHTEVVEDEPAVLPRALPDGLAPFLYARVRPKDASGQSPPAPRWRSRRAMTAKAPPEGLLEPEHDYAFVERRRFRGGQVLTTPDRRVVRERDVRRMKPSEFAGRDALARPIPAGTVMTWSIEWPYAIVRAQPDPEAEEVGRLPLHAEALAHDEPPMGTGAGPRGHRSEDERELDGTWVPMAEPTAGWVLAEQVRRWVAMDPPADVGQDEVWLDIELGQQVLALRRGPAVELVTLISSGNAKHSTPVGLFRLESKWAFADMRSRAGDDETYFVEGVPWVQYFRGRYALHGTFWHNRFGRRTSHGCINLSAHDARWVYERTSPAAKPGWLVINEHAQEPGTLVRIRKGTTAPPDRRRPPIGA